MDKKSDNIYIYFWEEFNTIYIGRTINPKGRHYAHKHRDTESTYQFSSEHHVEHPKMIIIENDLTVEDGVEREKYWIDYYRNKTDYKVLNKSCGGQIGKKTSKTLTEEEKIRRRKEYYQKNKNKILEYSKEYGKNHRDSSKLNEKKYRENHKKELSARNKKYSEEHKEELRLKAKKYREEHREEILIKRKRYREEHREEILVQKRRYREKHREELKLKAKEYMREKRNNMKS